ncbi:hypothetical protein GP486_001746 [Trichoglossum hirsutum]|uniref:Uncharacterized protein n=1 Tax=Trichoglossum hirsutum TaxID=265104 RepID=A0A9P8LG93_9PEZI|nr:hypothetical protein GP486_001746 [Trichoglossum hirsutum]
MASKSILSFTTLSYSKPTPKIMLSRVTFLLELCKPAVAYTLGAVSAIAHIPTARSAPLYERADDRSSTWQVLADGTQDLAALVGLFATDSVERYTIDYSRGYLGVAMSTCSMLGILGYVRALVKLGIGLSACVAAAFPSAPVRAYLGTAEEDRLPNDELVTVRYISRREFEDTIIWETRKSVNHTKESMPVTWAQEVVKSGELKPQFLLLEAGGKYKSIITGRSPPRLWHVIIALLASPAINCFIILLISKPWTWETYVAAFVMYGVLAGSALMWAYVYIREQVPVFGSDRSVFLDTTGEIHSKRACGKVSLRPENAGATFSFMEHAGVYVILPCTAMRKRQRDITALISLICSSIITLGYICQYIVIRQSSRTGSLKWLLVQGALTAVRAGLWMYSARWVPRIHIKPPQRMYPIVPIPPWSDFQASSGTLHGSIINNFSAITELELAITATSFGVENTSLNVSKLMLRRLERENLALCFQKAIQMEDDMVVRVKDALKNPQTFWDMPPKLFRKLLLQRAESLALEEVIDAQYEMKDDWTCRVLNTGSKSPWVGGEVIFVPLVKLSYLVDGLDTQGHSTGSPKVFQGWCTCFSDTDASVNMIQHHDASGSQWIEFGQSIKSTPEHRKLYGKCSRVSIQMETGGAGGVSISSELTIDGYTERWLELKRKLNKAANL